MEQSKECSKCGEEKSIIEFRTIIRNQYEWTDSYCRECRIKYARQYRKKNHGCHRQSLLRREYGITDVEYELMLKSQNGVCKICGQPETVKDKSGKIQSLSVDHCHKTTKIRGLLCANCNRALGAIKDDVEISKAITKYLEENQ